MARPRITADVLAQRGVPLALAENLKVTVCYTFKSLMLLEERYDSIQNAMTIVANQDGAAFTSMAGILACGLTHEVAPSNPGEPGDGNLLSDPEVLADWLEPDKIGDYADVMGKAFEKAFPSSVVPDPPAPTVGTTTETPPSPGPTGTTSPEPVSASPIPSFGA